MVRISPDLDALLDTKYFLDILVELLWKFVVFKELEMGLFIKAWVNSTSMSLITVSIVCRFKWWLS